MHRHFTPFPSTLALDSQRAWPCVTFNHVRIPVNLEELRGWLRCVHLYKQLAMPPSIVCDGFNRYQS